MWVLLAVLLVIVGFALRINPMLVVTVAGIVAGLIGHLSVKQILDDFGTGFAGSRSVTVFVVALPVIGLLERFGLQQEARRLIGHLSALTAGRMIALYLFIRQLTAALGLISIGGPAQAVRPLIVPMADGAAERRYDELSEDSKEKIKAFAASADNVGAFFGEDIFVAVGSILLITSFVDTSYHLQLRPLSLALWAIPTAIVAFLIHGTRMLLLDRAIEKAQHQPGHPPAHADTPIGQAKS